MYGGAAQPFLSPGSVQVYSNNKFICDSNAKAVPWRRVESNALVYLLSSVIFVALQKG